MRGGWRWAVAAAALSASAAALAVELPSVAVLTAGGLVAAVAIPWGSKHPRALIGATLLVALFVQPAARLVPAPGVSSLDEAFVVLCCACILLPAIIRGRVERFPGLGWFAGFAALGLLSSLLLTVPITVAGQGLLLAVKGLLVGWAAVQLDWDAAALRRTVRVGAGVFVLVLVCGLVNAAIPGPWTAFIAGVNPEYRGPFPSLIGPWQHASFFGQILTLFAVAALAYRQVFNRGSRWWLIAAVVGALLSFRRKTLVGLLAALGFLSFRRGPALMLFLGVPALSVVGILAWDNITAVLDVTSRQYIEDATESPRNLLFNGSVTVANGYFPFGAGFGRYGSYTAFENYSPEYWSLGFSRVWGLAPDDTGTNFFASDTFWPAVWGEAGWIGGACYVLGLAMMALVVRRNLNHSDPWVRWSATLTAGWFIALIAESIAAPVFVSPPTFPLLFVAVAVTVSARRVADRADEERSPARSAPSV